jgi:hypothetical protein
MEKGNKYEAADPSMARVAMLNLTVAEILAELTDRDDADLPGQHLSFIRERAKYISSDGGEPKAMASAVTDTIASLLNFNDEADDGQVGAASVTLVAAAKFGSPNIVEAVLTDIELKFPLDIVTVSRRRTKRKTRNQVAIVEHLTQQGVIRSSDRRHEQLKQESDEKKRDSNAAVRTFGPESPKCASAGASPDNIDFDLQYNETILSHAGYSIGRFALTGGSSYARYHTTYGSPLVR